MKKLLVVLLSISAVAVQGVVTVNDRVAVVEIDEKQDDFTAEELALIADCTNLVKRGAGELSLSTTMGLMGLNGIVVKEGFFSPTIADNSNFGSAACHVIVEGGATLCLNNKTGANLSLGSRNFTIAGTGTNGQGALCMTGGRMAIKGTLKLTADALMDTRVRVDVDCFDLQGHTLTKMGATDKELVVVDHVCDNGRLVIDSGIFEVTGNSRLIGGSTNTITLKKGALLQRWTAAEPSKPGWSVIVDGDAGFNVWDGFVREWNGPIQLNNNSTLALYQKANAAGEVIFNGDISGEGSLRVYSNAGSGQNFRVAFTKSLAITGTVQVEGTNVELEVMRGTNVRKEGNGKLVLRDYFDGNQNLVVGGGVLDLPCYAKPGWREIYNGVTNYVLHPRYADDKNYKMTGKTAVTYEGYIWNRGTTDVTWTFVEVFDDYGHMDIDNRRLLSNSAWNNGNVANYVLTPGWHKVTLYGYNQAGGGGWDVDLTSPGNLNSTDAGWNWERGLAFGYDPQARGTKNFADYLPLKDPGDGSFISQSVLDIDLPVTNITTLSVLGGELVLNDALHYAFEHVTATNGTIRSGDLIVAKSLTVTAPCSSFANTDLTFRPDSELFLNNGDALSKSRDNVVLTARKITGVPVWNASRWKLKLSPDGTQLLAVFPSGTLVIIK